MNAFEKIFVSKKLNEQIEECKELRSKIKELKNQKEQAEEALESLKLKKRLEQEEIVHMQKIHDERRDAELEKKKLELEKKYTQDINKFKEEQRIQLVDSLKEFHKRIEDRFTTELASMKELYQALMGRLPNVNYEITEHRGIPQTHLIEAKGKTKG